MIVTSRAASMELRTVALSLRELAKEYSVGVLWDDLTRPTQYALENFAVGTENCIHSDTHHLDYFNAIRQSDDTQIHPDSPSEIVSDSPCDSVTFNAIDLDFN
jgi:hypothetical protein